MVPFRETGYTDTGTHFYRTGKLLFVFHPVPVMGDAVTTDGYGGIGLFRL